MKCRRWYVFGVGFTSVAAAILAAVEGGILAPGPQGRNASAFLNHRPHRPIPPGRMPGSTAGKMPAATLTGYRRSAPIQSSHPSSIALRRVDRLDTERIQATSRLGRRLR